MKKAFLLLCLCLTGMHVFAVEYHVAKTGDDQNSGSSESPFLSIQAAANIAMPGDVTTVHEGIYRERIDPPRDRKSVV